MIMVFMVFIIIMFGLSFYYAATCYIFLKPFMKLLKTKRLQIRRGPSGAVTIVLHNIN